ncbi:hypothetical protein NE237_018584 [Protea cynaroides]|uniref:Uncharacterized protein n=1 Tax=Protea cynaroides TaxID=273540 RepID=A0A9Q0QP54_9MAGN|nr:hypothetical protein NE237_018584 [Protea cynaroides]
MAATNEAGEEEGVQVLLVVFSAQGHINPMLRFGKRLASKGLHVTLATNDDVRDRLLNSLPPNTLSHDTKIRIEFFSDGLSHDFDRKTQMVHFMDCPGKFGPPNLSKLINDLSADNNSPKFSCIIANPFVPWVADVAVQRGIPCALLWIQPCSLYAIYYHFYNNLNPFPSQLDPCLTVHLPGPPPLQPTDLPSFVLPSNPFVDFTKLLSELFQDHLNKFKWVLGNSFYELEKDVVESMADHFPIRPIGPLVPSTLIGLGEGGDFGIDLWKPEDGCIEWLDRMPVSSFVYVTFGSLLVLSTKQMENIASALKNSSRLFFGWLNLRTTLSRFHYRSGS